ncbi:MAG: Ribose ABC transporter, periplasmic ribose-binding protein RbsB [uncultured Rubrobacteraceae bacterium]|uniref:Ribose ABC transporter, periplasmic ribose-binding protein RbsB n=1 Tax=uncultured Rubrobacteraceae bacterium TaxID=349277 RepID=A0A6J4Q0X5_9ACTN|nr:MAG: Ribose ABC transporter, periplasmic ribose-binding protein RbsB [uncultured Rubrobacteraceae bacterium]
MKEHSPQSGDDRRWSRRAFLKRAGMTLTLPAISGGIAACGPFAGGGGQSESQGGDEGAVGQGNKTLGFAMINLTLPFFVRMQEAGGEAAKDYNVRTVWQSADGNIENEIAIAERYVQQEQDVILIDPVDAKAFEPVVRQAEEAETPVVTMGNKVEAGWNFNTLYPDYENMATVARALATALDEKGQIAFLVGSRGNYVSDTREAGFKETIEQEFPDIELVSVQPTDFDTAQAQAAVETWLTTYPDLAGIASVSDPLVLAAMNAAENAGRDDILYAGHDGDAEMHPMLKDGSMVIDVLTGAERVGYWNVAVGARIAKGEKFNKELFMPTYFVMADDMASRLADRGLEVDAVTPEEATETAQSYAEEFGPDQPSSAMSVG